jgi:putative SOS response-associated peptidase YedK
MCGRLENTLTMADYQSLFNVTPLFDLEPLPDIRPTDRVPIILPGNDQLEMKLARWGFSTPARASRVFRVVGCKGREGQTPDWTLEWARIRHGGDLANDG